MLTSSSWTQLYFTKKNKFSINSIKEKDKDKDELFYFQSRWGHTANLVDDKIYIFGGFKSRKYKNSY
jgi:hypothetical protein